MIRPCVPAASLRAPHPAPASVPASQRVKLGGSLLLLAISGGSLAWYYGLLTSKPSPYVVTDEDRANRDRLNDEHNRLLRSGQVSKNDS